MEAEPSASPGGLHRLAGPLPPPVLRLFQIPLISLSGAGAHPGLRRCCCCSSGFFPLLPPPPSCLPLPLHPSRAGCPGGRGHPGILIHSHCRSGRDVALRREARPPARPPNLAAGCRPSADQSLGRRGWGSPVAQSPFGCAGGRGRSQRGGASQPLPHPTVRARALV